MVLGARITAWRKVKGLTQSQLAEAAGISRAAMCQIEGAGKYKSSPSLESLDAIVKALGLTMAKFYGRVGKPKKAKAAA